MFTSLASAVLRPVVRSFRSAAPTLIALGAIASAVTAGDLQQYSDGTFTPSCWTSTKIVDTTPGASATFTSTTMFAGGNPTDYRETSHTFNAGAIIVAHMNSCATYDPSQTPICAVDFSYDLVHFTGISVGGAVGYRLALLQGGTYYSTTNDDVFGVSWQNFAHTGYGPQNFTRVVGSGPTLPDFSCAGAPITLGFMSVNSANQLATKVSGIDNWNVVLHLGKATYADGSFGFNWTSTKIYDSTPGATATFASVTPIIGGNPGTFRETTHTWGAGAILVAHLNSAAVHNPATEPVYSIDTSWDLKHTTGVSIGGAVGYRLAIQQGSAIYGGPNDDIFSTSWTSFSRTNILPSDFTLWSGFGSPTPDFSATGAPMTLGFISANSQGGPGFVTKVSGIDNWVVVMHTMPACTPTVGNAYCFGDGSGTLCPCSPTIPNGLPGRGCPNSVNAVGARLQALGQAKISNDTLVLQGSGMPNGPCLYFQGSAAVNNVFGDGLRCAGGQVVRLGVKINVCGSSKYPDTFDLPISIAGGATPPNTYHFQVWYRDAASYCTASTFNLTNGIFLSWLM